MSKKLHEAQGRLDVREARIRELMNDLIKMDERFRTYILPPLPHEIISFIHTISDLLRELQGWMNDLSDYRKAISEAIEK